jgi:hypothetical protein
VQQLYVGPPDDPDRYEIISHIGGGGEGTVFRAKIAGSPDTDRFYAVKQFRSSELVSDMSEAALRQVLALRQIASIGMASVIEGFVGTYPHHINVAGSPNALFLVMDWVNGVPLDEWLLRNKNEWTHDYLLRLLDSVTYALDLMHSGHAVTDPLGRPLVMVHGDLKPANVRITTPDTQGHESAVLVDFGLLHTVSGTGLAPNYETRGYTAPELALGEPYTPAADVYGFGAVIYFAITGTDPPTNHDVALMKDRLSEAGMRHRERDTLISALAISPGDRPVGRLGWWLSDLRADTIVRRRPGRDQTPFNAKIANVAEPTILLVHGLGERKFQEVARFLESVADANVVVLGERASSGATWIEHLETHGRQATHAVVIVSAQVGDSKAASISPSPDSNVVLELGYFVGTLGRNHVTVLADSNSDLPTDIAGVGYVPLDSYGGWRIQLARELSVAGVGIDYGRVVRGSGP